MTTPHTRAKAILSGLTKAQRSALLTSRFTPLDDLAYGRPGIARQLHDLGLTFVDFSPLGLAVRDLLIAERASGEVGL